MRYTDEIQCAAARVVAAIRRLAKKHAFARTNTTTTSHPNPTGSFDSFHIRRGDFQRWYPEIFLSASEIYQSNTRGIVPEGRTVYVATDETNQTFFEPLREHYHLLFLNDFVAELGNLNPSYYGMVDQLVASRGHTFFGSYYSTFSGYINRLRGYHSQKQKAPGYETGIINSYYFAPDSLQSFRETMRIYKPISPGFWNQEFPVAWRDIDFDVES